MEAKHWVSTRPNTCLASFIKASIKAKIEASVKLRHGSIEARCGSKHERARSIKASIEASAETSTVEASAVEASAVEASTIKARCGSIDARHRSIKEASTKVS
jgi:hypothetical protein